MHVHRVLMFMLSLRIASLAIGDTSGVSTTVAGGGHKSRSVVIVALEVQELRIDGSEGSVEPAKLGAQHR
jgi:hypothetical protein